MNKGQLDNLAIFGGKPAFDHKLHVGRPNVGDHQRLFDLISDALERRWFSNNGPYVQELEQKIADFVDVKHCIATGNATVALEIAIHAAGLSGEVIVPSFTFIATAHALHWQRVTPVFCDIDPLTHNINPSQIEKMITPLTSGIIGVHLWGRPCNIDALEEIASRHQFKLLFDAAHAFGCSYKGRMIGNFGDAEIFSFQATKFFNTFEGGAVTTNNDDLACRIRLMRNFGFSGYDTVIHLGINGKMNEISAAMGLVGFESMEEFISTNYRNYKQYRRELAGVPGVSLVTYDEAERCNYQYIVAEIEEEVTRVTRDQLMQILHDENVLARRYFYPGCHLMEPYRSCFPNAGLLLPDTERLADRVLCLPTGTAVKPTDISRLCQIIRLVVANGSHVRERLLGKANNEVPEGMVA